VDTLLDRKRLWNAAEHTVGVHAPTARPATEENVAVCLPSREYDAEVMLVQKTYLAAKNDDGTLTQPRG